MTLNQTHIQYIPNQKKRNNYFQLFLAVGRTSPVGLAPGPPKLPPERAQQSSGVPFSVCLSINHQLSTTNFPTPVRLKRCLAHGLCRRRREKSFFALTLPAFAIIPPPSSIRARLRPSPRPSGWWRYASTLLAPSGERIEVRGHAFFPVSGFQHLGLFVSRFPAFRFAFPRHSSLALSQGAS